MAEGSTGYEIVLKARDETRAAFEAVKNNSDDLTGKLKIIGGAFAATAVASATAVAVMVKGAIDSADAMSKAAQRTGTTTESLSALKYAADMSDVSFETLQKSLGKLSQNAFKAATAGGEAATAFTTLGINVRGADGHLKDSGALFDEIAGKLSKMPNSAEKSALAIQIFGKSGADLIPLLNSGSEGLAAFREETERLGLVISTEAGLRAEAFNDNLMRISKTSEGLANRMASDLLPTLNVLTDAYIEGSKEGGGFADISRGISEIFKYLSVAGVNVGYVFQQTGKEIGGTLAQLTALASGDFSGASAIGDQMKKDAEEARKAVDALSERIMNPPKIDLPDKRDRGPLPDLDTEKVNKALQDLLTKSEQFSKELVVSHESAFDKIVTRYVEMDAQLSKTGAAGNEQRKALAKSFEAFMVDEQDKRTAAMAEAAEKEAQANNKIVEAQQEKFMKMQARADEAALFDEERENRRYQEQLRELERDRQVLEEKGLFELASQQKYDAAKEALAREHYAKMSQQSKLYGITLVQFEAQTAVQRTQTMANGLAQMTSVGAQKHRALFEINKIASMANATISGVQAVQDSYKFGAAWGGPVGGAAMAAIAVAATLANIEAIRSTEFGGGAPNVGGGGVPSMATSPGIPTAPQSAPAAPDSARDAPAQQPTTINIYNTGNVLSQDYVENNVIPQIRNAVSNSDVLLIDPRSRQAQVLVPT